MRVEANDRTWHKAATFGALVNPRRMTPYDALLPWASSAILVLTGRFLLKAAESDTSLEPLTCGKRHES